MAKSIEDTINFNVEFAKKVFTEEKSFQPTFVLHTEKGPIPVTAFFENDDQKMGMLQLVQILILKHRAYAYSYMHEAWSCAPLSQKEYDEMMKSGLSVFEMPGAFESFVIAYCGYDQKLMVHFKIKREGDKVELTDEHRTDEAGGRFTKLLPPQEVLFKEQTEDQKLAIEGLLEMVTLRYGLKPIDVPLNNQG